MSASFGARSGTRRQIAENRAAKTSVLFVPSWRRARFCLLFVILLLHQDICEIWEKRLLIESFFILKFVPIWE